MDTYDPLGTRYQQLPFTRPHLRRGAHTPTVVITGTQNLPHAMTGSSSTP